MGLSETAGPELQKSCASRAMSIGARASKQQKSETQAALRDRALRGD